jgi:hypothetical protein
MSFFLSSPKINCDNSRSNITNWEGASIVVCFVCKEGLGMILMASESECLAAISRVKYGGANQRDYELCERLAKQVGSLGNKARDALRNAKR